MINKLILGDNLEIPKTMERETVDLIYLDPPFFSNRTYEVIWGDDGEKCSFEDRFAGVIDVIMDKEGVQGKQIKIKSLKINIFKN
jgi:hypothetical protein